MFRLIHRLQEKPLHERRRIAFWAAFVVTALVAFVWALTLSVTALPDSSTPTTAPKSPFSALFDGISEGLSALRNAFPKVQ